MGGGTRMAAQFKVIAALVSVGVSLAGDFPGAWAEPTGPGLRERGSFKRKEVCYDHCKTRFAAGLSDVPPTGNQRGEGDAALL